MLKVFRSWLVALLLVVPSVSQAVVTVSIETSKGTIELELDEEKAPITVRNFLAYVESDHYANTIFHRVMKGFMIQGGGFTADLQRVPTTAPIKLEAGNGLSNLRGTIAMARTGVRDSATRQFFINHTDNVNLDTLGGGYAVFGRVTKGLEVVDAIATLPTRPRGGMANLPVETVTIVKVTVTTAAPTPTPSP